MDFCEKYWKNGDYIISGWYFIFKVYYFEDKWIECDLVTVVRSDFITYKLPFLYPRNRQLKG